MALLAALFAVGCSRNPVTGKRQFLFISTQQEIAMGAEAAPQFEAEFGGKVPSDLLQNYVRGVGRKIVAVSDRKEVPYDFALLASDVPNAFALPGGKVYVTAGLMGLMTNERQLAAVLAHEVTHVAAKHNVVAMQRQMGAALVVELAGWAAGADKEKAAEAATEIAAGMVNLSYSRGDEYEADRYGITYMTRAGYNPWGMVELLEILMGLHETEPNLVEKLFLTHPTSRERIERAREQIEKEHEGARRTAADPNARKFLDVRAALPKYVVKQMK